MIAKIGVREFKRFLDSKIYVVVPLASCSEIRGHILLNFETFRQLSNFHIPIDRLLGNKSNLYSISEMQIQSMVWLGYANGSFLLPRQNESFHISLVLSEDSRDLFHPTQSTFYVVLRELFTSGELKD